MALSEGPGLLNWNSPTAADGPRHTPDATPADIAHPVIQTPPHRK